MSEKDDDFVEYEFMGKKVRVKKARIAEIDRIAKDTSKPMVERVREVAGEGEGLEIRPAEPFDIDDLD